MLKVIGQGDIIEQAMDKMKQLLIHEADSTVDCQVGYKSGNEDVKAYWLHSHKIWAAFKRPTKANNRFWNPFGTAQPYTGCMLSITVEINFPLSGINRRIGGAFAWEGAEPIYLVHSGGIGGGKPGISKSLFWQHYRGSRVLVDWGGVDIEVALIGSLEDKDLPSKIAEFVREVERIKGLV